MQSKDFRRGNLIKYEDSVYEIDIIAEVFPHLNTDLFGTGVVGWKNIEGIKINNKWLKKLGFKCRSERLFTIGHFEINILEGVYFVKSYYLRRFEYVHELQNLYFALTGKELELKSESKP